MSVDEINLCNKRKKYRQIDPGKIYRVTNHTYTITYSFVWVVSPQKKYGKFILKKLCVCTVATTHLASNSCRVTCAGKHARRYYKRSERASFTWALQRYYLSKHNLYGVASAQKHPPAIIQRRENHKSPTMQSKNFWIRHLCWLHDRYIVQNTGTSLFESLESVNKRRQ